MLHHHIVKIMVWIIMIIKMVNIVMQMEEKFGEFLAGSTIFKGLKKLIEKNKECVTDGDCKFKFEIQNHLVWDEMHKKR